MTRKEIRDWARKKLGETTSAFWTDAELNNYINSGCQDVAWRAKCLRANGTITLVSCVESTVSARSNEFTISSYLPSCFAINEVYLIDNANNTSWRLEPTTREEMDVLNTSWQSLIGYTYTDPSTGVITYNKNSQCSTPIQYYWSREEDMLGVNPPPDADMDGAVLKCYYTKAHPVLSSDSDSPVLPVPIHLAVVDFVMASGLEDRGWGDRANDAWGKYFSKIKDYLVEKKNEREDDVIIMKNYRNI